MIVRLFVLILFFLSFAGDALLAQDTCDCEISGRSERLYERGREDYLDRDFSDAMDHLRKAVDKSPENYKAHLLKGYINVNRQNRRRSLQTAKKSFLRVAELCPSADIKAYYYLGEIYFGAEEWKKAAKYYDKFLISDPEGQKKVRDGDFDHAETMYKKAKFNHRMYSNEVPFDPKPVKGVSTPKDEYLAIMSPDHKFMFFTRKIKVNQKKTAWDSGNRYTEKFMKAERKTENRFTKGKQMPDPFNGRKNEGGATITIDNKHLYLTICENVKDYYNCDICHSSYDGEEWTEIENLGSRVNNDDTWEAMPTMTSDGEKIYFVSDREGGYGGYDIWFTQKKEDGSWSKAQNAGPAINTPGDESSPFIHTDSKTLYFSSRDREEADSDKIYHGHKGLGGFDILYIRLGEDGWTEPKNIGYPINTENDELGFFVSTDGKKGYFATNQYSETGDYNIYYFDLHKEARPEKVLFLKGKLKEDKNDKPVKDASIELKNVETKEVTTIDVDDETGKYVTALPFKSDYVMTIKSDEHVYESRYISSKKPTYLKPTEMDIELKPFEVGESYRLNDIYFATDSDELTENSKKVIKDFVEYLDRNNHLEISIRGHTDNVGKASYNLKLSRRRAKSVYDALISRGIDESRLEYKGFGEKKPVADNSTEEGRAKNRRTEFVIKSL